MGHYEQERSYLDDDRQAAIFALQSLVNSLKSGSISFDHKLVVIVEKGK